MSDSVNAIQTAATMTSLKVQIAGLERRAQANPDQAPALLSDISALEAEWNRLNEIEHPLPLPPTACPSCNIITECGNCGKPVGRDGKPLDGKINTLGDE